MKAAVIDASCCLAFLLPDEKNEDVNEWFRAYIEKQMSLVSPTLLEYEVANGLSVSIRRARISPTLASSLFEQFLRLEIPKYHVDLRHALQTAERDGLTLYDACYLHMAIEQRVPLLTLDKQLKRAYENAS